MKSKVNKMGVKDASTLTQNNNALTISNCGNYQLCEEYFDVKILIIPVLYLEKHFRYKC